MPHRSGALSEQAWSTEYGMHARRLAVEALLMEVEPFSMQPFLSHVLHWHRATRSLPTPRAMKIDPIEAPRYE
jgi:hypothetical protein